MRRKKKIDRTLKEYVPELRNDLSQMTWRVIGIGVVLVIIGLFGLLDEQTSYPAFVPVSLAEFHRDLATELFGIGITVILIDAAYRWSNVQNEKTELIRQFGSSNNGIALSAMKALYERGSLADGSLRGANLVDANLRYANLLQDADLRDADLRFANLERAYLRNIDLRGADLTSANLRGTRLIKANLLDAVGLTEVQTVLAGNMNATTLPDGCRYDGRYRLPGDLKHASNKGLKLENTKQMARKLYGISQQEYVEGQMWADHCLDDLRKVATDWYEKVWSTGRFMMPLHEDD